MITKIAATFAGTLAAGVGGIVFWQGFAKLSINQPFLILSLVLGITMIIAGALTSWKQLRVYGAAGLFLAGAGWLVPTGHAFLVKRLSPYLKQGLFGPKELVTVERLTVLIFVLLLAVIYHRLKEGTSQGVGLLPARKRHPLDIAVTRGSPVIIPHMDRYLHTMIVGTTGTGKSSWVLKPMIEQDLQAIAAGHKIGVTVIEPKGDLAEDVAAMCREMGVPVTFINPDDPSTPKFNPLAIGDETTAAEIARTVFKNLFGKQEAFFSNNQQQAIRSAVLLLRRLRGKNVTLEDVQDILRNFQRLKVLVETLERREGPSNLTDYFRREVLEPTMQDKIYQWLLGLRLQLDNILGNPLIKNVLVGESDIDLDEHLAEGRRVLVVNTAMHLGTLGDFFGQFVIMHLESAVFRRPGNEWSRPPHALYIDEFPRYANADFERLLAIGRSFRCATTIAMQNTEQIVLEENKHFREITLGLCRNKIILNPDSANDAKRFAAEMGQKETIERHLSYKRQWSLFFPWHEDSYREEKKKKERFEYTEIMEIPKFHAIVRVTKDGEAQPPVKIRLNLSKFDERRRRRKPRKITGKIAVKGLPQYSPGLEVEIPKEKEEEQPWFGPSAEQEVNFPYTKLNKL